jgi:hypothetical protein
MAVGDGTVDVLPGVLFPPSFATLTAHIPDILAGLHLFSSLGNLPFFFTSPSLFLLFPSNRLFIFYLIRGVNWMLITTKCNPLFKIVLFFNPLTNRVSPTPDMTVNYFIEKISCGQSGERDTLIQSGSRQEATNDKC